MKEAALDPFDQLVAQGAAQYAQIGGDFPDFTEEYAKKYGRKMDTKFLKMKYAQFLLTFEAGKSERDVLNEVLSDAENLEVAVKRFGVYLEAWCQQEHTKFGSILHKPANRPLHYPCGKFQSMKNCKIAPWILRTGETHVSIGCVDFAQLLFAEFEGDPDVQTHFHGVDLAMMSITRCKVLYEMLRNQASSRAILQVWFSTGWAEITLKEFLAACKSLLEAGDNLAEGEKDLLMFWISNKVTIDHVRSERAKEVAINCVSMFRPCANFRHEVDRVDYARYLFTGYIFEENEKSLMSGNRTMFAIPQSLGCTKVSDENFYNTLDINQSTVLGLVYTGSLKRSTDGFIMQKMEKLKEMVSKDQLRMTFEHAKMSVENRDLIRRIHEMNPCTMDWSNIADYCSREDFLAMAERVSGEKTIHNMHFMKWSNRVPGTFITDYDEVDIPGIIRKSHVDWKFQHSSLLQDSATYRYIKSYKSKKFIKICFFRVS